MEKDYHLHKSNSSPTKIKNFGRSLLGHEDKLLGILAIRFMKKNYKEIQKMQKEINHLKAKQRKEYDKPCYICKTKTKYSEKYDAYYCPKCLYWHEMICPDRKCSYCKNRPKYPR